MGDESLHPSQKWRFVARLFPAVLGLCSASCGELDPCPGVEKGARFEIEVQGPTNAESCHEAWGLGVGTVIEGTIIDLAGEYDCKSGVAEIQGIGDWSLSPRSGREFMGGSTLDGYYDVTNGSCSAILAIIVASDPPLACDASQGDRCNLKVDLRPAAGNEGNCPGPCGLNLNVRVQRP